MLAPLPIDSRAKATGEWIMRRLVLAFALTAILDTPLPAADDYDIGYGDVLHVAVLGQSDMTGDFAVDS